MRASFRRLVLGLSTLLGLRRGGWFIPYRYADTVPLPGSLPSYEIVAGRMAEARSSFEALLDQVDALATHLLRIADERRSGAPDVPRFDQGWFPTLDAVVAYTLVRQRLPRRIVEVGSGHSTRFLSRAARDAGIPTEILAIDPAPRADIAALPNVRLIRRVVQGLSSMDWPALASGDLLFIDSSHILMPGSDVDHLVNRILPSLPAGVLVHVHDIFLPDDYPAAWGWRNYNEQQAVVPMLAWGGWHPVFSSHYVRRHLADRLAGSVVTRLPTFDPSYPSSLWLERAT